MRQPDAANEAVGRFERPPLAALVANNLGRPDGAFALVLGAGGLFVAAVWIAAMPMMTNPGRPPDGRGE